MENMDQSTIYELHEADNLRETILFQALIKSTEIITKKLIISCTKIGLGPIVLNLHAPIRFISNTYQPIQ